MTHSPIAASFAMAVALGGPGTTGSTEAASETEAEPLRQTDVFTSGSGPIHTFRIPAMIVAPNGALLVFCEARKKSISDASPTDMVLKRSRDGGRTWLPMQVLIRGKGKEAIMNPCPVVDRKTGAVLLFCVNAHKIAQGRHCPLMITSKDHGNTWSPPVDVSTRIAPSDDTFVPGPGVGIQLEKGRLVIPGYTGTYDSETRTGHRARIVYSDDGGRTWRMGKCVTAFSNECQVVELADGRLMLNMRDTTGQSCRGVALSSDGGETWTKPHYDRALNECPCQASFIRYTSEKPSGKNRLLFANPDVSGHRYGVVKRTRMTVRLSYDEGKTWPVSKLIHAGPSSYSSLVALPGGDIGLVYEGGKEHRREWIRFARFSLDWLTGGKDALKKESR